MYALKVSPKFYWGSKNIKTLKRRNINHSLKSCENCADYDTITQHLSCIELKLKNIESILQISPEYDTQQVIDSNTVPVSDNSNTVPVSAEILNIQSQIKDAVSEARREALNKKLNLLISEKSY